MAAVPATGGVVGHGPAGRLVGGLTATTFALITAVGGVLVVVGAADAPSRIPTALLVDAGLGLVAASAAWSVSPARWRVAAGMAVLLAGWLLPTWAGWLDGWGQATAVLLAAAPLMVAGVATASLSWSEVLPRTIRSVLRGVWALVVTAIVVLVLGYDPFADPACRVVCRHMAPPMSDWVSTHAAVQATALLTVTAALVAGAGLRRSRTPRPVASASAAALALLSVSAAAPLVDWADPERPLADPVLPTLALSLIGAAVLAAGVASARVRRAVERLASGLSAPEEALAGQKIRSVAYAMPDEGRWVDARGVEADAPRGRSTVLGLFDGAGPAVRLEMPRAGDAQALPAGLSSATRLALANGQLAAVARARLADVQASQRRLVATGDAERRRMERDLHDGVQQRLVSVALHLRGARPGSEGVVLEQLVRAEEEIHEALGQLRRLAHGVFPFVLTDDGLAAALEDLAGEAEVATTLDVRIGAEPGLEAAMAAYATVSAVVGAAGSGTTASVHVQVIQDGPVLVVCISVSGATVGAGSGPFTHAVDRVGALGGHLSTASDGAQLRAVIPCAW